MHQSDYVQEGEAIHHECAARLDNVWDDTQTGEVVCTDSRLVYVGKSEVRDVNLTSIVELVVKEPSYLNGYTVGGAICLFIGLLVHFGDLPLEEFQDLLLPLIVLLYGVAIAGLLLGIYFAKWTVIVKTPVSKYVFRSSSKELVDIAHAIRGAQ